jgi:hypothetical protein
LSFSFEFKEKSQLMKKDILSPPNFCQYDGGVCTRIKGNLEIQDSFFAYPSSPEHISTQVHESVNQLKEQNICSVQDWKDMEIGGKIYFL